MKANKLTYEDHVEIGTRLKQVREDLLALRWGLCKSEGPRSPIVKAADRATCDVDALRTRLDSLLCAGLPLTDESWRGVYYGKDRSARSR